MNLISSLKNCAALVSFTLSPSSKDILVFTIGVATYASSNVISTLFAPAFTIAKPAVSLLNIGGTKNSTCPPNVTLFINVASALNVVSPPNTLVPVLPPS